MTVRAQIGSVESGGRLDFSASTSGTKRLILYKDHFNINHIIYFKGYNEQEAWTAFYRAAQTHGWDVKGLGPQMFPKFS